MRYLQGLKWNYEATQLCVVEHHKWFKETFPIDPTPFKKYLDMGIFYGYKRDKGSRPILIVNVERIVASGVTV